MKATPLAIPDVYLIEPQVFGDERSGELVMKASIAGSLNCCGAKRSMLALG